MRCICDVYTIQHYLHYSIRQKNFFITLSFLFPFEDGGGIRGLILIQVLLNLERVAMQPIVKLFDWIAGTSTGGILALGLLNGRPM